MDPEACGTLQQPNISLQTYGGRLMQNLDEAGIHLWDIFSLVSQYMVEQDPNGIPGS
jgi:hypothetical protein